MTTSLGIFFLAASGTGLTVTGLALLTQAAGADVSFKDIAQGGAAVLMAGVLWYVVRVLAQTNKESAERAALAAKENAERTAAQERECGARNEKTVASVDAICDRFSETQIATTKQFTETVTKLLEQRRTG